MPVEKIPITSRDHWLDVRKPNIGASQVGGLLEGEVHPYLSPLKLYMMHSGIEFSEADNEATRRGRLLENSVGIAVSEERDEWILEKNELPFSRPSCPKIYFQDPDLHLGCTPDFFIHGDPRGSGILQAKTAAPHVFEQHYQGGTAVPFWIQLQCLTEMMLTDASFGVVAVLQVSAFDLRCSIIPVERRASAEKKIRDMVTQFWLDVEDGNEPSPDYNRDTELLKYIAPREVPEKTVDLSASNELPALLEQRDEICEQINAFTKRKNAIETQLKFAIRDAERVTGLPEWSITWKTAHRKEHVVAAKDIRTLHINRKESRRG